MRAALRSSGWMLAGSMVGRGAMLVATIAVARLISPTAFGTLNIMQTAIVLLTGVAGLGLAVAVTRQAAYARATEPETVGRYVGTALALTTVAGLVVVLAMLVLAGPIADVLLHDGDRAALVRASAAAVLFAAVNAAVQGALLGFEAVGDVARAQAAQGALAGGGMIAGAAAWDAHGGLLGFSAGQALAAVVACALLRRAARARDIAVVIGVPRRERRELWRFGLPTFAGSMAIFAAVLIGQVILSHEPGGYEEVAIFNLAYRWHLAILFVPAAVAPLLVPTMSRLHATQTAEVARVFRASLWGVLALSALPALAMVALAPWMLGLSGDFYREETTPLIVLAVAAVPSALNTVLSSTSISLGAVRAWLLSDLVLAMVLIGGAAILVAGDAATGLALAYLVAYTATCAVLVPPLRRRLRS